MNKIQVRKDNKEISLEIVKTKNRNSSYLVKEGFLLVRAGNHTHDEIIDFVNKRFDKFFKLIKSAKEKKEDDNSFIIFSKKYVIDYLNIKSLYKIDYDNKIIYLKKTYLNKPLKTVKEKIIKEQLQKQVNFFNILYENKLKEIGLSIVPVFCKKLKTKYGYCSYEDKKICISTFMIKLEERLLYHLLFHEYSHFIEPNHSKKFYKVLEKLDPMYYENNKLLKQNAIIF